MKMKGYSKINLMNSNTKSKSIDFSDQITIKPSTPQKPISIKKSPTTTTQDQTKNLDDDDDYDYNQYSGNNHQEQVEHFPMENLKINQSATSHGSTTDADSITTHSSRFKIQKQHSTGRSLQTAVKRVMSIRRSSSVSERYARIHDDQYASYPLDVYDLEDEDQELQMARSKNSIKKTSSGSILKACKRIFGL